MHEIHQKASWSQTPDQTGSQTFWIHFCCFTKTSWRFKCVVPFKLNLGDEERVLMLRHGTTTRLKGAQASQSLETRNQDYLIETSVDARLPWDLLPETPHLQISCFIPWRSSGSTLSFFLTWSCSSTLFWWLGGCNSPPRRFALSGKPPQWIISDLVKVLVWCWHWIISVFGFILDVGLVLKKQRWPLIPLPADRGSGVIFQRGRLLKITVHYCESAVALKSNLQTLSQFAE